MLCLCTGEQEELLCECLSAVGRVRSDLLPALVPDLSAHLTQLSEKQPPPEDLHNRLVSVSSLLQHLWPFSHKERPMSEFPPEKSSDVTLYLMQGQ